MERKGYTIKTIQMPNGERLPMLLGSSGIPVHEVVIYVMAEIRGSNKAGNTIVQVLQSIRLLYTFLDSRGIALQRRLGQGEILSLPEIQALVHHCKLPFRHIKQNLEQCDSITRAKVIPLEKIRQALSSESLPVVSPLVAATRLIYIRNFLSSLSRTWAYKHGYGSQEREKLIGTGEDLVRMINSRLPFVNHHRVHQDREGLNSADLHSLFAIIAPDSPQNPWRSMHSKARNELLILWLYYLGLRRGELLTITVSDVSFFEKTVLVARRADNPKDPRKNQPLTKTKARRLPIGDWLLGKTEEYVKLARSLFKAARKHEFLFVADGGAPLSVSACNKVFAELRIKCPDLPRNLFPHIFRHTWNDRFSEIADQKHFSEAEESKMRSHLMGWSETSGTAAIYTKRHTRQKANEALLEMQKQIHISPGASNE